METQSNSLPDPEQNEDDESKTQEKKVDDSNEPHAANRDYHDYVPHHFNHGRSNARTFGVDHEPGTRK